MPEFDVGIEVDAVGPLVYGAAGECGLWMAVKMLRKLGNRWGSLGMDVEGLWRWNLAVWIFCGPKRSPAGDNLHLL